MLVEFKVVTIVGGMLTRGPGYKPVKTFPRDVITPTKHGVFVEHDVTLASVDRMSVVIFVAPPTLRIVFERVTFVRV
jgi:hypothetical protein